MTHQSAGAAGLPVATGRQSLAHVWRISRGHRLGLVLVCVLGIAAASAGLVLPIVVGRLVDSVQAGTATAPELLSTLAVLVTAAVAGAAGTALTIVLAARAYHAMLAQLREDLVAQGMRLPQGLVERAGTGDLVSRSSDDVAQIADAAPQIIPAFTMTGFTIAVTLAGMTALDWWYGLALVVVLPIYILTIRWYLSTAPGIYAAERAAMTGRAQQLIESQRGADTVTGFGLGRHRHERVLEASWGVVTHSLRARTVQNMFFGRLNLAEYLGLAALLAVGFWLIGAGLSTVGAATAAVLLFLRLFGPINQLLFVVDVLQSVGASLNRIVGVIATPAPGRGAGTGPAAGDRTDPEAAAGSGAHGTAVTVEAVDFSYDGERPALTGIDLSIPVAHRVAVVGASGAGKTTLGAVIAGIHSPDAGAVTVPARTVVVTQEVHVFSGTLRENLTLAAPEATDEDILAALRATGSAGLLEDLPEGLDTAVGASGVDLTAAVSQQLALARLVLADPDRAILDEATAEAGSSHAGALDRAADVALRGRSALVIAHRLTQAAACDRIVVMDAGRIVEEGDHDELLRAGGTYARLWSSWTRPRASGAE
jgi:ATP-binding cassette subfamily C protein